MNQICHYGCGNTALFQFKNKKWCCQSNTSKCPSVKKNLLGNGGYDYNSLSDETKLKMSHKGQVFMTIEEVFIDGKEWGSELLRKYLHHYKIIEYKCSHPKCGITDWNDEHLVLELDHISGKRNDNRKENLRWLCPNCHSQTPTFRGYNKTLTGKKKVSDEDLLTALNQCCNIRQALQSVGLAAKGGNYERASKLLKFAPMVKSVDTRDLEKI